MFFEPTLKTPLKRTFDIVIGTVGLMTSAPFILVTALGLRVFGGTDAAIFRQERMGLNGHRFSMTKLKTMNDQRGPDGKLLHDDIRTTPFGRFVRRSRLDELPQFWHVLNGDMSFVGPRPTSPEYNTGLLLNNAVINSVRPGLLGLAQNEGRLSEEERLPLDIAYAKSASLLRDVPIILNLPRAAYNNWRTTHCRPH